MAAASGTTRVLVTGAGGFIGHHLVGFLKRKGYWVRGVDLEYPEFAPTEATASTVRPCTLGSFLEIVDHGSSKRNYQSPRDGRRWLYRPPSCRLSQAKRVLGARRRPGVPGIRADRGNGEHRSSLHLRFFPGDCRPWQQQAELPE